VAAAAAAGWAPFAVPDAGRGLAVSAIITGVNFDVALRAGMTVRELLVEISEETAVPRHLLQLVFQETQRLVEIPDADLGAALLSRTGASTHPLRPCEETTTDRNQPSR
jgi:hypothetical protein